MKTSDALSSMERINGDSSRAARVGMDSEPAQGPLQSNLLPDASARPPGVASCSDRPLLADRQVRSSFPGRAAIQYAAIIIGIALTAIVGCGGDQGTMADRLALAGDTTSCSRNQLDEPASCMTPPAIICSTSIEACAADGCQIVGDALVLYSDFSWRDPNPGAGPWSTSFSDGFEMLSFGVQALRVDTTPGTPIPGCN